MATFNNIGGQEPSTVTFRLATVNMARGSTTEQQEIMVLGDPDTSNALAAVLNTTPASTAWALAVRDVVPNSTIQTISTVQGAVIVRSSAANALVTAYQSSAADLNVTVAGYVAPSTTVSVAAFPSGMVSSAVAAAGSSALLVRVVGGASSISSIGGVVATSPASTVWASSAGFHFDSSGALQIAGTFSASTTVNVSSLAGKVLIAPNSTAPEPALSVRISDGSTWVVDYLQGSTFTSTAVAGGANFLRAGASSISSSDTFVMPWGSTFGAQFIIPVTDSGVSVMDSTNRAINVNVVAGSAASTIVTVSTGSVRVIQSSAADLNVTVSGYSTIAAISSVSGRVATMPNSTLWASSAGFHFDSSGALNIAGSFSAQFSSTKADNLVTVYQSTASELKATVSPSDTNWASSAGFHFTSSGELNVNASFSGSTIVTVSTGSIQVSAFSTALASSAAVTSTAIGLIVRPIWSSTGTDQPVSAAQAGTWNIGTVTTVSALSTGHVTVDTGSIRVMQSTAADLNVTVAGYSTTVNVSSLAGTVTAAIITPMSSVAPSSGSSAVSVRPVIDVITTFASTSALASTLSTCVSSAANIRAYVTAYSITSTNQTPAHWGFFTSATLLWPVTLAALSSGVAGANLAVSAPAYLFRTAASEALNFKTAGSTVSGVQLGVSYFLAP